jgi:hypothetical protein
MRKSATRMRNLEKNENLRNERLNKSNKKHSRKHHQYSRSKRKNISQIKSKVVSRTIKEKL